MSSVRYIAMTFEDNATDSNEVDLINDLRAGEAVVGVEIPSGFVGTTLKFKNKVGGSTFLTVVKSTDGTDYTVTCAASKSVAIPPAETKSFGRIKGVADSQTAGPITLNLIVSTVA